MKPHARTSPAPADHSLDRLYAAPFDDFVSLRKALAAELRAAGNPAASRDLLAAKKPSRTAWAINQLARTSPDELRAAFEAFDTAARGQPRADARVFRERVSGVVVECERLLADAGASLSAAQVCRLTETIRAAIAGGAPSRERLLSGRLTEDVEMEDPFAGLEARAGTRARQPEPPEREQDRHVAPDPDRDRERQRERELEAQRAREARERAVEKARHDVAELEAEARDARDASKAAEAAASRAQADAERARRNLAAVEERLARAHAALREM